MYLIFRLNLVLFLSLALTTCGGTTSGVAIDDSKLVPSCFSASGSNPLLTTSSQSSLIMLTGTTPV